MKISWAAGAADRMLANAAVGMKRADESLAAIETLRGNSGMLDDALRVLGDGSTWDDPIDGLLHLAETTGNPMRAMWSDALAAQSVLKKASTEAASAVGHAQSSGKSATTLARLQRAEHSLTSASDDAGRATEMIEKFFYEGGSTFDDVSRLARTELSEAAYKADEVLAAFGRAS